VPACRASGAGRAGLEWRAGAGGWCARTGSVPNPRVMEVIVPPCRGELTPMREAKESQDRHRATPDRPTAQRFSSTLCITRGPRSTAAGHCHLDRPSGARADGFMRMLAAAAMPPITRAPTIVCNGDDNDRLRVSAIDN
jgi:hypothetical protein